MIEFSFLESYRNFKICSMKIIGNTWQLEVALMKCALKSIMQT